MDKEKQHRWLGQRPAIVPSGLGANATITDLVGFYERHGAYQAGRLAAAAKLFARMVDEGATIALTLTGAMTPAGLGGLVAELIEGGFVDLIVSTGANIYHDLHFALGFTSYRGTAHADDSELKDAGIERIYDVFITEEMLLDTDQFVRKVVADSGYDKPVSSSDIHHALGAAARTAGRHPERSFVVKAAQYEVPIFTSSPGDSSIGMNLAALKLEGKRGCVDPDLDVLYSTAIVNAAKKNGVVVVGGGSPKNFYLQTQPTLWQILNLDRGGHDYYIGLTADSPQWGGLSGATPSEAISWGKIQPHGVEHHLVVYGDATVTLPVVAGYGLSVCKKREPKRLYRELPELYDRLRREAAEAAKR